MLKSLSYAENLNLSYQNIGIAVSKLSSLPYSAKGNAILQLLMESQREVYRLKSDMSDLTSCSLSVRNIFELYLIIMHVYSDEKALMSWYGQSHKDSKDIRDGFITLAKKRGMDTSELEEIQRFEDKSLEDSPFHSKGGFQIRNLAEKYNYLEDYLAVYKLNSKLIHPTSIKVNTYEALVENSNYLNIIIQIGVFFSHKLEEFTSDL